MPSAFQDRNPSGTRHFIRHAHTASSRNRCAWRSAGTRRTRPGCTVIDHPGHPICGAQPTEVAAASGFGWVTSIESLTTRRRTARPPVSLSSPLLAWRPAHRRLRPRRTLSPFRRLGNRTPLAGAARRLTSLIHSGSKLIIEGRRARPRRGGCRSTVGPRCPPQDVLEQPPGAAAASTEREDDHATKTHSACRGASADRSGNRKPFSHRQL